MKYCEEYLPLLDLFVDGECTPEETERVQTHLATCPGCKLYVHTALAMRDAFADVEDTEVPGGFADGVLAAVRADAAPRRFRRTHVLRWALPLAACLVIMAAVGQLPRMGLHAAGNSEATAAADTAPAAAALPESVAGAAPQDSASAKNGTPEAAQGTQPDPERFLFASGTPEMGGEFAPEQYGRWGTAVLDAARRTELLADYAGTCVGEQWYYVLDAAEFAALTENLEEACVAVEMQETANADPERCCMEILPA